MKNKTKYTPGPWPIKQTSDHCWNITIGEQPISILREANARLIAAAPDMKVELEHTARNLRRMINFFPADRAHSADIEYKCLCAWFERTEAAIAKAGGR